MERPPRAIPGGAWAAVGAGLDSTAAGTAIGATLGGLIAHLFIGAMLDWCHGGFRPMLRCSPASSGSEKLHAVVMSSD